jgi:hypothetical protein
VAEYHATIGRKARLAFDKAQDVDVSVSSANVELRSGKGKRICMGAGT